MKSQSSRTISSILCADPREADEWAEAYPLQVSRVELALFHLLRLIAEGDSNATIAGKLVLSEKTVKGHVSNILSELHIMDRTQAAAFAWHQGLMVQ